MVAIRDLVMAGGGGFGVSSSSREVTTADNIGIAVDSYDRATQFKQKRDATAYNIKAETDLQLFGIQALEDARVQSQDPEQIAGNFFQTYEKRYQELRASAPNVLAQEQLDQRYQQLRGSLGGRAISMQAEEVQGYRNAEVDSAVDSIKDAVVSGKIDYKTGQKLISDTVNRSSDFNGPTYTRKRRNAEKQGLAKLAFLNKDDKERYTDIMSGRSPISGDIDAIFRDVSSRYGIDYRAMLTIAQLESGMNPNAKNPNSSAAGLFQQIDDNARQYGISNKMDPAQSTEGFAKFYMDNKPILQNALGRAPTNAEMYLAHQQGASGAKELLTNPDSLAVDVLASIYKDKKDPIAFAAQAIENNGGSADMTASEFSALWLDKYAATETMVGDGFTIGKTQTAFDDLSPEDKITAMTQARNFERNMQVTKKEDPGKFSQVMGLNDEQSIAMQGGRERASLLPIDEAKQIVAEANRLQNVDDVYRMADSLKERGGNNYDIVMRDLRKQELNPRVESAINLANNDAATYKQHIELFMDSYQLDKGGNSDVNLDGAYKRAGYDKSLFVGDWSSSTEELRKLMVSEGIDASHIESELGAYESLAMMHSIRTGEDMGDSIEFALQPLTDWYNKITLNGNEVRIPKRVKMSGNPDEMGQALDKSIAQTRIAFAYDSLMKEIRDEQKKMGQVFDEDMVYASLNPSGTGIWLRGLLGEPVINKVTNAPYEIDFAHTIKMLTPQEVDMTNRNIMADELRKNITSPQMGE